VANRFGVFRGEVPIDGLSLDERAWAPIYVPLPSLADIPIRQGDTVKLRFHRSLSDDGTHPDYHLEMDMLRNGHSVARDEWTSAHHPTYFRSTDFYRELFRRWPHIPAAWTHDGHALEAAIGLCRTRWRVGSNGASVVA
jgi:hypothetical protein